MTLGQLLDSLHVYVQSGPGVRDMLGRDIIVHVEDSKGYEITHAEAKPDNSIRLSAE